MEKGEVIAIIGPSGSGKSTLLRCLIRLESIDKGSIVNAGKLWFPKIPPVTALCSEKDIRTLRLKMGMVFQNFNLFPHKSVLENLIDAPLTVNITPGPRLKKLPTYPGKSRLIPKKKQLSCELSGGQQPKSGYRQSLGLES